MNLIILTILMIGQNSFAGDCTYRHGLWSNSYDLKGYKVVDRVLKKKGYQLVTTGSSQFTVWVSLDPSQYDRFNIPQNIDFSVNLNREGKNFSVIYEKTNKWLHVKSFKLGLKRSIRKAVSNIPECKE